MPQTKSMPVTDQIAPLAAVTVYAGRDENSLKTLLQASAVQTLSMFKPVMDNTTTINMVARRENLPFMD